MNTKHTILLVDDEPDLLEFMQMELEDAGYRVIVAGSGNSAIALLGLEKVDLIVSDMRMPNGSGLNILDYVKSRSRERPDVLFITGFSDIAHEELLARGAAGIISKPFVLKDLLETIGHLLLPLSKTKRRKADRFEVEMAVELRCPGFSEAISAGVANLSRGGMFVVIDRNPPPLGSNVEFALFTPTGTKVAGKGAIRWIRKEPRAGLPPGVGLEFLEVTDDEQLSVLIGQLAGSKISPYTP